MNFELQISLPFVCTYIAKGTGTWKMFFDFDILHYFNSSTEIKSWYSVLTISVRQLGAENA